MASKEREETRRESDVAPAARKRVRARCGAPTIRGGVCTAPPTMPDGRCPHHSSTVSEKTRQAWRDRGRRHSMLGRKPVVFPKANYADPDGVQRLLESVTDALLAGKLPTSTAKAVSSLAGAAAKLTDIKLAEKIAEIERQIAEKTRQRTRS
jgi:hypothetical protein